MALAGLCVALSSSTQLLYAFGQIDHHFAEHICILASLAAGLSWFKAPSVASGIALGVTFGIALAIHNALFILQLPFLLTALLFWLQGTARAAAPGAGVRRGFAAIDPGDAAAFEPFQEGRFEFYYALLVPFLRSLRHGPGHGAAGPDAATRRNIGVLTAIAVVLDHRCSIRLLMRVHSSTAASACWTRSWRCARLCK